MTFTEPPDPKLSLVHVLDVNGTPVEAGTVGAGPGTRRRTPGRAPRGSARRRVHGELARGVRGRRPRDGGRVQLRCQRGSGHGRHAERPRADDALALRGERRRQAPALRGARAVVRRRGRRAARVRRRRPGAEAGAADRGRGGRGRRRHDAPVRARHARRVDGRPAVVGDRDGLPLVARRGDVRRGRGARRGTEVRPDLARRCRGRRGGGHARPCHGRSRRRRGDPGAPDRPAVAPLHGRERVDGRPRADVPVAPRATPDRGRRPGRRGAGVLVPGGLRAGGRARHRRAPRDAGGRGRVEAVRPVPRLVRNDARRQGRRSSWC